MERWATAVVVRAGGQAARASRRAAGTETTPRGPLRRDQQEVKIGVRVLYTPVRGELKTLYDTYGEDYGAGPLYAHIYCHAPRAHAHAAALVPCMQPQATEHAPLLSYGRGCWPSSAPTAGPPCGRN